MKYSLCRSICRNCTSSGSSKPAGHQAPSPSSLCNLRGKSQVLKRIQFPVINWGNIWNSEDCDKATKLAMATKYLCPLGWWPVETQILQAVLPYAEQLLSSRYLSITTWSNFFPRHKFPHWSETTLLLCSTLLLKCILTAPKPHMARSELLLDHLLQLYKAQRGATLKIHFSEKSSAWNYSGSFQCIFHISCSQQSCWCRMLLEEWGEGLCS